MTRTTVNCVWKCVYVCYVCVWGRETVPIELSHLARWLGVPVCTCQGWSHGLWVCKALLLSNYPLCMFNKTRRVLETKCYILADWGIREYNLNLKIKIWTIKAQIKMWLSVIENPVMRRGGISAHTIKDTLSTSAAQYFINTNEFYCNPCRQFLSSRFSLEGILLGRDVCSNRWLTTHSVLHRVKVTLCLHRVLKVALFHIIVISIWTDKRRNYTKGERTPFGSKVALKLHRLVYSRVCIIIIPPCRSYVRRLNLTRSRLSALHYSSSYFWNGCVSSFFFFFLLALIDWCVIFSSVPLGTVLHTAQCLKAWNHCEDLMQSCRIISGLLGSFPHNHLNGFPRVVSAIGIRMQKGKSY